MIVLYADAAEMGDRIESLLADCAIERVDTRRRFSEALRAPKVGIAAFTEVGDQDVSWLQGICSESLSDPPCVVVTPCRLDSIQRCRSFDLIRLRDRVVWLEELEIRLRGMVRLLLNPLTTLGERIIAGRRPRAVVAKAVTRICHSAATVEPPPSSVAELARSLCIGASTLSRYWATDVPYRCGPKQLLKWALLFWAIERRTSGESWYGVARSAGRSRRTLRRYAREMAGCGLAAAAEDPDRVRVRFEAWVREVEKDG